MSEAAQIQTPPPENKPSILTEKLKDIGVNEIVIGFTLVCYITGFMITNIYLGSLGIIHLDLLRVRYIMVGFLFMVFIGFILLPVYGFWKVLLINLPKSNKNIIMNSLWYSITTYAILSLIVGLFGYFTGSNKTLPIGLPNISSPAPVSKWFDTAPITMIRESTGLFLIVPITVIFLYVFMFVIIMVSNPKEKDGTQKTRKENIREYIDIIMTKQAVIDILFFMAIITILLFIFFLALSFIFFIRTNEITGIFTGSFDSTETWLRFLLTSTSIYFLITTCLLILFITAKKRRESKAKQKEKIENEPEIYPYQGFLYLFFIVVSLIGISISVYSIGIYPSIPQQIGGGRVVPVQIITTIDELDPTFTAITNEVYLVDRASTSSIFLVLDTTKQEQKVIELTNSEIQSITYEIAPFYEDSK